MSQQNIKNRQELLLKFESWTEIPLIILVVIMIITLVLPLVIQLPQNIHDTFEIIDWGIWAIFALELSVRTYLAEKKLSYLRKNWIDILVVLLPVLRVFRVLRAARLLRVLRFVRILSFFAKFTSEVKTVLSHHHFHYLLVILLGLIGVGSVLIYHFDQGITGGNESLPDAVWIAIVNAFSGGYANVYPAGPEAKGVSVLLILVGTIIVSYFTASLASYFSEKSQDIEQKRIENKLDNLIEKVDKLDNKLTKKN